MSRHSIQLCNIEYTASNGKKTEKLVAERWPMLGETEQEIMNSNHPLNLMALRKAYGNNAKKMQFKITKVKIIAYMGESSTSNYVAPTNNTIT